MNELTILFVDDETSILNSLKRTLYKESYRLLFAQGGEEALALLDKEEVHVVVTDMQMPGMDGLQLLEKVRGQHEEVVRIVLSGFTDISKLVPCINSGEVYRYITKPIDSDQLRAVLNDAINLYRLKSEKKALIKRLERQNRELEVALDERRAAEGRLSSTVDELRDANYQLTKYAEELAEQIEKRQVAEQELCIAQEEEQQTQSNIENLLLKSEPPQSIEGATLAVMSLTSKHLAGDFVEFFDFRPDCFDLLIGDVMGKGPSAALISAGVKQQVLSILARAGFATVGADLPSVEEVMDTLHNSIIDRLMTLESFLTLNYARINLRKNSLEFVDCGHMPILHYRAESAECIHLKGDNVPLGFMANESYKKTIVGLKKDDLLLFYTDGVTEIEDAAGEQFGIERLAQFVSANHGREVDWIINELRQRGSEFSQREDFADDFTCAAIRIY